MAVTSEADWTRRSTASTSVTPSETVTGMLPSEAGDVRDTPSRFLFFTASTYTITLHILLHCMLCIMYCFYIAFTI